MSLSLSHLELDVVNPTVTAEFYEKVGWHTIGTDQQGAVYISTTPCFGNIEGLTSTCVILHRSQSPPEVMDDSCYWKIGLTTPNLEHLVALLKSKGIQSSAPHQFEDVGYLSHIKDPDGLTAELLQETFQGNQPAQIAEKPGITFAHITLRVSDMEANLRFYRDLLGMKLLSRQNVEKYGFCLYFLAWTNDSPPNIDVNAVENREWLWQRKYTVLELQEKHGSKKFEPGFGLKGIRIKSSNLKTTAKLLMNHQYKVEITQDDGLPTFSVADPNGIPISFDQLAL